jgi:hypothetical protein
MLILLFSFGCGPVEQPVEKPSLKPKDSNTVAASKFVIDDFAPVAVEVMPLTEITISTDGRQGIVNAYISLLDSFNCSLKWPAVFRLELYQRDFLTAEQKGKRVQIWPDVDLTDVTNNNKYWKDFLRAYQFTLNFEPYERADYVLLVTCFLQNQKRISAESPLKAKLTPAPK